MKTLIILISTLSIALCDDITLYDRENYQGASKSVTYDRCINLLRENDFNDRAKSVKSSKCVKLYEHSCCQGKSIELKGDTANLRNFNSIATSISPCGNYRGSIPTSLREKWLGHSQLIRRVFSNDDISLYYNDGIDPAITWPRQYLTRVWQYVKRTYGSFGPEGGRLHPVFHGSVSGPTYGFNSIQNYFDMDSDCRNLIDVVSTTRNGWSNNKGINLDIVTHEVSHIVEGASKGVHGSPTYRLWGDSKWAEIFNYDVYKALGMTEEMNRWYNEMIGNRDNFPKPNTYWFRDWFFPIYSNYGGSVVLNNYFDLLAKYFPRNDQGYQYDGNINMGEFVHFYSGAAGRSLKDQADKAFKWDDNYEAQFNAAKKKFPQIVYIEPRAE